MAKGFCNGCVHWIWDSENTFHYCDKFSDFSLRWRKLVCNGVYYEKE